jgi:hypothetical protein
MENYLNQNPGQVPNRVNELFGGFEMGAAPVESSEGAYSILVGRSDGNTILVWDYQEGQEPFVVQLLLEEQDPGLFDIDQEPEEELVQTQIPLDEFKEQLAEEEEIGDEEPGIPSDIGAAIEQLEEIEPTLTLRERQFPELDEQIRQSVTTEGFVDVPLSNISKKVEARSLYSFEFRMGLTMTRLEREGIDPGLQLDEGIGFYKDMGMIGTMGGNARPPAHFPLTSIYIKNRLLYEGPSYPLEIFNDLVVYSLFISNEYDTSYKPSSYDNIRLMIDRVQRLEEEGYSPKLIRRIPQAEAEERGLDTMPQLPSGRDAPWLEPRQYYEIIEENADHPAWRDVTGTLYGDEEPETPEQQNT